jgi:small subunit ribosomal protein S6
MRPYEIALVLRADLGEEDLTAQVDAIKSWVQSGNGTINQIDAWGRRRLAYTIDKQHDGYYMFMKAELPSELPFELERNLRITENVLRYLVLREDD